MRLPSLPCRALPVSLLLLLSTALVHTSASSSTESTTLDDGLIIQVTRPVKCNRPTQAKDKIAVNYRGTLEDGTEFDASYNRGSPFTFSLGSHQVIKGWDEGLMNMCVGEARRLVIPPELGYGDRRVGPIPAGSTLIFDTELDQIVGIEPETLETPETPESTAPNEEADDDDAEEIVDAEEGEKSSAAAEDSEGDGVKPETEMDDGPDGRPPPPPPPKHGEEGHGDGPKHKEPKGGECRLLGPFALFVQGALGAIALLSLVFKRWRERPRRPLKIWFFDVSKQVVGTFLLHLANLGMSMFSSGDYRIEDAAAQQAADIAVAIAAPDGKMPNPCSFYLLNLAIDTTIGIPVLVISLKVLHALFLKTYLADPPESIKSGHYGQPARVTWWMKQSFIYFIGLFIMKLFVFFLFQALPWIAWVGDWALRWTEGNEALQIAFVMFIFPVAMNAIQYYIIDGFIKEKEKDGARDREGFQRVASHDAEDDEDDDSVDGDGERRRASVDVIDEEQAQKKQAAKVSTQETLTEANPTTLPTYSPPEDEAEGEASSTSSPRK